MADRFSGTSPRRRPPRDGFNDLEPKAKTSDGGLFGWTIFILLLIGLVAICWMGTLYIFGHPEQPLGYSILHKFKKLEAPKRFSEIAAPKGEFLDAKKLLARYGQMSPRDLEKESQKLLRDYLRNYQNVVGLVPYITGRFQILDSYELTPNDFFSSGVVAVAQEAEVPQVLIEDVFPTDAGMVPALHRTLLTGTEIPIQRSINLSPILHVERLADGRLKFTTVPIQYPDYSAMQGPGSFSLEPPATLNVEAGLPVLAKPRLAEADQRFATYRRKLANPGAPGSAPAPEPNALMPVRAATTTDGQTPTPAVAAAPPAPAGQTPPPAATPPPIAPMATSAPPEPRVLPAIPVNAPPSNPVAAAPAVGTDVPLKPFMAGSTSAPAVASTTSGKWQTYKPGQMPRGRLVGIRDTAPLADAGLGGERIYLQGDFVVRAAGQNRAVLRNRELKDARIIVEFPNNSTPPTEGASVARDAQRPFLVTRVERGSDGTVNIWAREVTSE